MGLAADTVSSKADAEHEDLLLHNHHAPQLPSSPGLLPKTHFALEVRRVYRHPLEPRTSTPPSPTEQLPQRSTSADSQDDPDPDFSGITVEWSPDIHLLLGYEKQDVAPTMTWWLDRIHPEDRDKVISTLREHFAWSASASTSLARLWYSEYRIRKASPGDEYLLVGDRMNTTRHHGLPSLSESFMFDLGKRKASHRPDGDLDTDNFRIVTENMHSGLFMMNAAGYVTFMNPAAERLTGFKFSEISKLTFHEAVHSIYPDGSPYPIHECPVYGHQTKNEAVQNAEEVFIARSGRFFPIKYSVAPLRGGYEHGAVIEFRDISEEKQLEHERMEARLQTEQQTERVKQEEKHRKQMGEFIDYVCHEVRNPLHGIAANAAFLSEAVQQLETISTSVQPTTPQLHSTPPLLETALSAPDLLALGEVDDGLPNYGSRRGSAQKSTPHVFSSIRAWLRAIEECAAHQSDIINNVLDLSRLEAGKVQLSQDTFSPWQAASQAVQMVSARAMERHIKLDIEVENAFARTTLVQGDATTIRQIFLNLLSNACKFAYRKGSVIARIGIDVNYENKKAIVRGSVTDQGVGMDDEDLSKLFQRFSQVNRRVSSEYGGSGLGLNISRELVRLLNGNLTVESEKHVGSTFSFSAEYNLPSQTDIEEWYKDHPGFAVTPGRNVTPTPQFAEDAGPVDDVPTFTHIMAAEDNALNRKILGRYLHDRPTVALTTDGQEAFEYFASDTGSRVQLIVMDCEMPRLDGRKATQKIRALEAERRAKGEHVERVPIIGLSGNARPEQIAEAKDCGMDDYLSKPCSKSTLEEMISKWERVVHARSKSLA